MPASLPPPLPEVEVVVVHAPRLAPLGGEAAFSAVQVGPEILKQSPRLDEALRSTPGVSLFRRTTSLSANPTTQGVSLRAIGPSGAGRALVLAILVAAGAVGYVLAAIALRSDELGLVRRYLLHRGTGRGAA